MLQLIAIFKALISRVLPKTTAADVGMQLVVGGDGHWVAGEPTTATIAVDGTKLTITEGE